MANKWVLLLIGALIVTTAFVITFTTRQGSPMLGAALTTAGVTSQPVRLSPAALERILHRPTPSNPIDGVEPAERHNLYEMRRYQQRALRILQLEPGTILPATYDVLDHHR